MVRAYIDRFLSDDLAVLLFPSLEKEQLVRRTDLPMDSKEGSWLQIELDEEEQILSIHLDLEETKRKEVSISERLAHLKKKKKSRFQRE